MPGMVVARLASSRIATVRQKASCTTSQLRVSACVPREPSIATVCVTKYQRTAT